MSPSDLTPEERARLLDPVLEWTRRSASARSGDDSIPEYAPVGMVAAGDRLAAVLQEAVEVLADLDVRDFRREVSPELAHLLVAERMRRSWMSLGRVDTETPEGWLAAMVADGLRVRGRDDA